MRPKVCVCGKKKYSDVGSYFSVMTPGHSYTRSLNTSGYWLFWIKYWKPRYAHDRPEAATYSSDAAIDCPSDLKIRRASRYASRKINAETSGTMILSMTNRSTPVRIPSSPSSTCISQLYTML